MSEPDALRTAEAGRTIEAVVALHLLQQGEAGHLRQLEVDDHAVDRSAVEDLDGLLAGRHRHARFGEGGAEF